VPDFSHDPQRSIQNRLGKAGRLLRTECVVMSVKHALAGAVVGAVVVKGIPAPFIIAGAGCALLYTLVRLLIRLGRIVVQRARRVDWLDLTGRASEVRISALEQELATAQSQVVQLEATHAELSDLLRIANGCVADLEKELRIAKEEIRIAGEELRYERAEADPLYQRVGLSQNAPSWLVVDARRCFRRKLHPDRYPEHGKELAHKFFVAAEVVFDRIYDARGLRA
jgi:hypothetical protein